VGRLAGEKGALLAAQRRSELALMVEQAPQRMQELLAPHVDRYVNRLLLDMDDPESSGHRAAMRIVPEILKAVGSANVLVQALVLQLGGSVERAREAVELMEQVPDDAGAIYEQCKAYCAWYDSVGRRDGNAT
jgi:hypothetical protein